ncbi:MAG TPA: NUDIX domain-containing protein [Micromonosporaceae bacterium]|nr:NUDIX domain-containing protein [Micromonosporaceae bacterium]
MPSRSRQHAGLRLTVDLAILTVREGRLQVLLIERGNEPYRGQPALPGGFLRIDENLDEAARRELLEETGLDGTGLHLDQLAAFSAPDRDPRGRVVTVPYLAIAPNLPVPVAGSDASGARWEPVDTALSGPTRLAFDHHDILQAAVEKARRELEYTTVATRFCGETFTIGDLRAVYEVVWGMRLDPRNFSRKVTRTEGFIEPVDAKRMPDTGRPAQLYRAGPANRLYPPMLRTGAGGNGVTGP